MVALHGSLNRAGHGNRLGQYIWIAVAIAGERRAEAFGNTLAVYFPSTGHGQRESERFYVVHWRHNAVALQGKVQVPARVTYSCL